MLAAMALGALALGAAQAQARGMDSLAKALSKGALKAGVKRLAVLPLRPLDGSDEEEGRRLAEALATDIAMRNEVLLLERSMLQDVMSEHSLGQSGALDSRRLARLGAMEQADAVVAGTFVALGNTVELNVRMVAIETGAVLAARSCRVKRGFSSLPRGVIPEPSPISADMAVADVYEFQTGREYKPRKERKEPVQLAVAPGLRDAMADPCADAAARADALQESVLELKARYWAKQARKRGFSASSVAVKPGAGMTDPGLRRRFYELMKEATDDDRPLSMSEVKSFVEADRQAFDLLKSCSL